MEIEALYKKLYEKYTTLKKKKFSELDEVNKDQEVKFLNYVSAAEELIQHQKSENDGLRTQVSDLRSEVLSIRATKDEQYQEFQKALADSQKTLSEEIQKSKMLAEEVERLQKLLQEKESLHSTLKDGKNVRISINALAIPQTTSAGVSSKSTRRKTRKRGREVTPEVEESMPPDCSNQDKAMVKQSEKGPSKEASPSKELLEFRPPECSSKAPVQSGTCVSHEGSPANCRFQVLIECLVGLKLTAGNQTEGICVSAVHESSGYSFSLTWANKTDGNEPELLYRVVTLGTFERVAPEWMRSTIMFSINMCPIFFERVSRAIKLQC